MTRKWSFFIIIDIFSAQRHDFRRIWNAFFPGKNDVKIAKNVNTEAGNRDTPGRSNSTYVPIKVKSSPDATFDVNMTILLPWGLILKFFGFDLFGRPVRCSGDFCVLLKNNIPEEISGSGKSIFSQLSFLTRNRQKLHAGWNKKYFYDFLAFSALVVLQRVRG